jgi:hypothetical protein
MKRLVITFLSILVLGVVALPGPAAAKQITTVGPAFNIFTGHPSEFQAGAPFHFLLGWDPILTTLHAIGKFSWSLDVDGTPRAADFHFFGPSPLQADALARAWFFNFPDGMSAGSHTFVAHGFTPCYFAVSSLGYPGPCSNPNAAVEAATFSMTVTFFL